MWSYKSTYTDFNGTERTETFNFFIPTAELMEMQLITEGGLDAKIQAIIDAKDQPTLIKLFKELLLKSYGEKSDDGRRFVKSEEMAKAFSETPVYSELYMRLITDSKLASEFVNGITPDNLEEEVKRYQKVIEDNQKDEGLNQMLKPVK